MDHTGTISIGEGIFCGENAHYSYTSMVVGVGKYLKLQATQ